MELVLICAAGLLVIGVVWRWFRWFIENEIEHEDRLHDDGEPGDL